MTHGWGGHHSDDEWCLACSMIQRKQWQAWAYEHGIAGSSPYRRERAARALEYDHEQALIEHESRKRHGYYR